MTNKNGREVRKTEAIFFDRLHRPIRKEGVTVINWVDGFIKGEVYFYTNEQWSEETRVSK